MTLCDLCSFNNDTVAKVISCNKGLITAIDKSILCNYVLSTIADFATRNCLYTIYVSLRIQPLNVVYLV